MTFNEYINRRRKELNMTVDELVERSGLPKGTVSKITAGINTNPKLTTIEAICRALMISVDDAMGLAPAASVFSMNEIDHINKYRSLDKHGRKAIDSILDIEYEYAFYSLSSSNRDADMNQIRFHYTRKSVMKTLLIAGTY